MKEWVFSLEQKDKREGRQGEWGRGKRDIRGDWGRERREIWGKQWRERNEIGENEEEREEGDSRGTMRKRKKGDREEGKREKRRLEETEEEKCGCWGRERREIVDNGE
jgi:hypothetical protein